MSTLQDHDGPPLDFSHLHGLFAPPASAARKRVGAFDIGQEDVRWINLGGRIWSCGHFLLGVHPRDWTRWSLKRNDGAGEYSVVAEGWTPPYGPSSEDDFYDNLDGHPYIVGNDLDVPHAGLSDFLAFAQEMSEQADRSGRPRVGILASDLSAVPTDVSWLVPGVAAPGWFTIIGGREKGGKGWLTFYLLGCLERGEDSLFGPSGQASSVIYTEEPLESIEEKRAAFGLQKSLIIFTHQLAGLSWEQKTAELVRAALGGGHRVLFLDNASRATGVEDENGPELARLIEPLAEACKAEGITLLVNHHHKKGKDAAENKLRGGTGLPAAADVVIDLTKGRGETRKRHLSSRGRLAATNWTRTVELTETADEYIDVTEDEKTREDGHGSEAIYREHEARRLITEHGPATVDAFATLAGVSKDKGRRLLNRLADDGVLVRERKTATSPYLYRLP